MLKEIEAPNQKIVNKIVEEHREKLYPGKTLEATVVDFHGHPHVRLIKDEDAEGLLIRIPES